MTSSAFNVQTCKGNKFRSVAHLNFASIATDLLIPQRVLAKGSWQLSLFFAVCTLVPQVGCSPLGSTKWYLFRS